MKTKQPAQMSVAAFKESQKPVKASKYGAKITYVDGIRFMSKAEAARYCQLKVLERAGEISGLTLQPAFKYLSDNGRERIMIYRADFRFEDNVQEIIEDVKGMKTPIYKLKKKMVEDRFGIKIIEITMGAKEQREAFALYGVEL